MTKTSFKTFDYFRSRFLIMFSTQFLSISFFDFNLCICFREVLLIVLASTLTFCLPGYIISIATKKYINSPLFLCILSFDL